MIALMTACPAGPTGPQQIRVLQAESLFQVAINSRVTFYATVDGTQSSAVTWSIDEPNASKGSIAQTGEYTSPATVPTPDVIKIRATSKTNPSDSGALEVKIVVQGGISGSITLPSGLLSSPPSNSSSTVTPQAITQEPQVFKPDWNAPRVAGVVLIVPKDGLKLQNANTAPSLQGVRSTLEDGVLRVTVPAGIDDRVFAERVAKETGAVVQPLYRYRLQDAQQPNDSEFGRQTNLVQIDAAGAWGTQTSVPDGLIAVLDTGLKMDHPDVAGKFIAGKDFCPTLVNGVCTGEDADPSDFPNTDVGGHGSFSFGVIAASTNNANQIAGITQSGKALAVKVFYFDAIGAAADSQSVSKGIRYAADQGAKVINMSFGVCADKQASYDTPDQLTANAIQYAVGKGAVLIAAAGNNGAGGCKTTGVMFPANNPEVIAVGSVGSNNTRSSFSAFGPELDITAPGESVVSLGLDNNLVIKSGTSFSAPQVSAVAGLMLAKNPSLTRAQVKSILESTARNLGNATQFGAGLLQAGAAVRKAANPNGAAQAATTIYVYADRLRTATTANCPTIDANKASCYDGDNAFSGRGVVTLNGSSGATTYSVTISRNGQPLQPGTYRVVGCVNKNSNAVACDAGDLGGSSQLNVNYTGTTVTGVNVTLAAIN